jgi:hypothetical protein
MDEFRQHEDRRFYAYSGYNGRKVAPCNSTPLSGLKIWYSSIGLMFCQTFGVAAAPANPLLADATVEYR